MSVARLYICDEHGVGEATKPCCKEAENMGWAETPTEQNTTK